MGECFQYNHVYFTTINEQPATMEEFVPGPFAKLINNDGKKATLPEDADDASKDLFAKAVSCSLHICIIQPTTHPTRCTRIWLLFKRS